MHAYIPFLWASLPPTPSHLLRSSQSSELRFSPFIASSHYNICMIVGQSLCHVQLFVTTWTAACQTSLSFTISQTLLKFLSIKSVMASKHLILCHPLLLLPSIFPGIRVFSNESALHVWWPKYYWSFSFSISLSNEYSGLISFRMDWFDLLAAQGTLKHHLQHHSSKASFLWCSAFFIVQLSHPYMTTAWYTGLNGEEFLLLLFLSGYFQAEDNDTMASTTNSQIIVCHLTLLLKLYLQKCKA